MTLSSIRQAVAGMRHDYFDKVDALMLKAFIDDSGSGGDSPYFVLAGYIGTIEAWDAFDKPWRAILDRPKKIEYFKSSEAESRKEQFSGFSIPERNERIGSLIHVIGQHALRALYVRMKQQDYNEVIKPYVPERWDNPYFHLFIGSIAGFSSLEKHLGSSRPIRFIFDRQNKLEKPSRKLYGQVSDHPLFGSRVIDVHYEDEKTFLPLQAADLLAWQTRRRLCVTEPPRCHFEGALWAPKEKPYEFNVTRQHLEEMGEAMDQEAMVSWACDGMPEHLRPWRRPRK